MIGKSRTSAVLFSVIALTIIVELALALTALGQQRKEAQESVPADPYPTFIKVYSKDGKQSLTGNCKAKDPATGQPVFRPRDPSSVNEITCTLTTVRYMTPDEKPKETPMPSTDEEFIKYAVRDIPKFAEELKRNPKEATKKAREEFNKGMAKELCNEESFARLQKLTQDIQIGPKMKGRYQAMTNACRSKDFKTLVDEMNSQDSRTCSIWVENFTLDFKRIGKGKWLTGSEPQGLCNVVEVFELEVFAGTSMATTVKSTVLTVGGTRSGAPEFPPGVCKAIREDTKKAMEWSLTNQNVFEPTCDFIVFFRQA